MKLKTVLTLVPLALTLVACDSGGDSEEANGGSAGGKADDADGDHEGHDIDPEAMAVYEDILSQNNRDHDNIISMEAFSALFRSDMGETHQDFHSLRRWYLMPRYARERLLQKGKDGSQLLQEGDPGSGIEFCVMHGVMIDLLANEFPCDPEVDRSCLSEFGVETDTIRADASVFLGWGSDEELIAQLRARGVDSGSVGRAQDAIRAIDEAIASGAFEDIAADPASGISDPEDAMCLFMQTSLRLGSWEEWSRAQEQGQIDSGSDARFYRRATEANVGIHNSLHGMLMAPGSAIDVGSPLLNLYNSVFWGIHGWVEFKWREARSVWYPNCGDGPGVLWNPEWDIQDDRDTIIENCGETYYDQVATWGLSHGIHLGHHFREPEAGDMGAPCGGPADCNDGFVCNEYDEGGGLCFADPDRSKTPASSEGIEVESIFEVDAKDRTPCAEGDADCGEDLAELEPGHPSLPE